uniref:Reverse transcriptase domain-containing protein n=1 Tax=Astyanax mexicanus TaxID=7994 RepID=A0A3B1JI27_ASTMX
SAALYILAISPLIKCIKDDSRIQGVKFNGNKYVISAYADDITVLVKSKKDLEYIYEHFNNYEKVSGAELNKEKSECLWIGDTGSKSKFTIDIQEQKQIKILGIYFDNKQCVELNWTKKEEEIEKEIEKYSKIKLNYKTRINIMNTFILPKTLFLACIFPPTHKWAVKINKKMCTFIWGSYREIAKRDLVFKNRKKGGLGAINIVLKLNISFCKVTACAINRETAWTGNKDQWARKHTELISDHDAFLHCSFLKIYFCVFQVLVARRT